MSIQKQTVLPNGVSGNFWVTNKVYVSPSNDGVVAVLQLFQNHASWVSGAPAIDQRSYELTRDNNPVNQNALIGIVETNLINGKTKDFVSGTIVH